MTVADQMIMIEGEAMKQNIEQVSHPSNTNDVELCDLLSKVYHKMETESKPLDADMAKILSDNMLDLF